MSLIKFTSISVGTVLLGALFLIGATHQTAPVSVQHDRAVVIEGVITKGNVLALAPAMLKMFHDAPEKPIDIIISSPGGEMVTGFMFLNLMDDIRDQGGTIRCFVPTFAASMAFQIFLHCDERYALPHAFLLWHGVRTGVGSTPVTEQSADDLNKDLAKSNELILADLRVVLGRYISEDLLMYHYLHETLHVASQLDDIAPGFMIVKKSIPGVLEAILDPQVPHAPSVGKKVEFDENYQTTIRAHLENKLVPAGNRIDGQLDSSIVHLIREVCDSNLDKNTALNVICKVELANCLIDNKEDSPTVYQCLVSTMDHLRTLQ